jgi:hypothetical protein
VRAVRPLLPAATLVIALMLPVVAAGEWFGSPRHPNVFGTRPLPISIGASHRPANGDSGGATVSGDNRKTRLVAFHSAASNLVGGDTNRRTDVFIWRRPRGTAGLRLNHLTGRLRRVSINSDGAQGNGDSRNPSLDGSLTTLPHCIAFQSTSTNLAPGDADPVSDIFVRDLRTRSTYLVSSGVDQAATNPSIDGHCHRVAFEAGGRIWIGHAHGGRPRRLRSGSHPSYARDGRAVVWTSRGMVWIDRLGVTSRVGPGSNPRVSDEEYGLWGISFETRRRLTRDDHDHYVDVYMRIVGRHGGAHRTLRVSIVPGKDAYNGGITAFGQRRGIVVFGIHEGRGSGLWYFNKHTGHADDLALTTRGQLYGIATSARANFVAFTARRRLSRLDHSRHRTVYFKQLVDGQSYGAALPRSSIGGGLTGTSRRRDRGRPRMARAHTDDSPRGGTRITEAVVQCVAAGAIVALVVLQLRYARRRRLEALGRTDGRDGAMPVAPE